MLREAKKIQRCPTVQGSIYFPWPNLVPLLIWKTRYLIIKDVLEKSTHLNVQGTINQNVAKFANLLRR